MAERKAEQGAERAAEQSPKRVVGRPFQKGTSGNPGGKPRAEAAGVEVDGLGGVVTAERMRKVLGQSAGADVGPTEGMLRRWLEKDPKGYIAAADEKERAERGEADLKAEVERLAKENEALRGAAAGGESGPDQGTRRCLGLLDEWLADPGKWEAHQ